MDITLTFSILINVIVIAIALAIGLKTTCKQNRQKKLKLIIDQKITAKLERN